MLKLVYSMQAQHIGLALARVAFLYLPDVGWQSSWT